MSKKIFLDHGEAYGNLGDEAMLISAVRRIRDRIPKVELIIPRKENAPIPEVVGAEYISSYMPLDSIQLRILSRILRKYDKIENTSSQFLTENLSKIFIKLIQNSRMSDALAKIRDCDALYFVGGAYLNDFTRFDVLLAKAKLVLEAKKDHIPVIFSSQSVGPCKIAWSKELIAGIVMNSDRFYIRDGGISKFNISGYPDASDKMKFVGDEAFSTPPSSINKSRAILENIGIDDKRPIGIFHFRATNYLASTRAYYEKLARAINDAEIESQIIFMPMSYSAHSGNDHECGRDIQKMVDPKRIFRIIPVQKDITTIRSFFELAAWSFSLSYHVQVFSMAAAKPFGVISTGPYYAMKAEGMKLLTKGFAPIVNLDVADESGLVEVLKYLDNSPEDYINFLHRLREEIRQVNNDPIDYLDEAIS